MPRGQDPSARADYGVLDRLLTRVHPDLVLLQLDPEPFLARQRFLSQRAALAGTEDFDVKALQSLDPGAPHSWEEVVVNLAVLDMLETNQLYEQLDLTRTFSTFSYPELSRAADLQPAFTRAIGRHLLGDLPGEHLILVHALYVLLQGKHKVMLGDMPETLYRQVVAGALTLDQLKDAFRFVADHATRLRSEVSFREAAHAFLPHIFQAPRDLYLTALLREAFQAAVSPVALVAAEHFAPILEYWQPPPHGINFSEATRVPARAGEPEEDLIEKHALLDSLLERRAWGAEYISNPFPYLTADPTALPPGRLDGYLACFDFHYRKYEAFKQDLRRKNPQIKPYRERFLGILEGQANEDAGLSFQAELESVVRFSDVERLPVLNPRAAPPRANK